MDSMAFRVRACSGVAVCVAKNLTDIRMFRYGISFWKCRGFAKDLAFGRERCSGMLVFSCRLDTYRWLLCLDEGALITTGNLASSSSASAAIGRLLGSPGYPGICSTGAELLVGGR